MSDREWLPQQGGRLVRLGIALFLAGLLIGLAASNFGGAVRIFAVPRVALSAHLIALMQGTFLVVLGLLWPRLELGRATSNAACWLLLYGFLAALSANLLAAASGAGGAMLPIAAGQAQGSALQEGVIAVGLRTAAVAQIASLVLILWGLRRFDVRRAAGRPR